MVYQTEDRGKLKRQRVEQAIQLAMQGRWAEAVEINRATLELFPDDVDAYNRLGKALSELGRYSEARDAYNRALELDGANIIAKKNLARLATLGEAMPQREVKGKADPTLFIEETGKTGITTIQRPSVEVLARMHAGDHVYLHHRENALVVENAGGEYLGEVEPRISRRLIRLMESGNRYAAAITSVADKESRIIIKEIYQHPTQAGRLSFPPSGGEPFRPYIRGGLLKRGREEVTYDEAGGAEEWEEDEEDTGEGDLRAYGLRQTEGDEEREDEFAE